METKRIALFIVCCLLARMGAAQADIREIEKDLVRTGDSIYASKFEVSNVQYAGFLNALTTSGKREQLAQAQIDTNGWKNKYHYNEPYATHYHSHAAYANHPVVNISHTAAELYCEWLTTVYNADPKRRFKRVRFFLPDENSWMLAAKGGDSTAVYPWIGPLRVSKWGESMCNYNSPEVVTGDGHIQGSAFIPAPVTAYQPNPFGLYNMSGNVAEMLATDTITKGGSWFSGPATITITAREHWDGKPAAYIGFRFFMKVVEK